MSDAEITVIHAEPIGNIAAISLDGGISWITPVHPDYAAAAEECMAAIKR